VTEHPSASLESGHGLERVIFFSDAVIAIALTLLALELGVPAAHDGRTLAEDFWDKMGHQYPAFLISFAVIAMFWFNHHRLFRYVARLSPAMIVLNTAGLLAIVLMPFATKLTWELEGDSANAWGTAFYAFLMSVWAVIYLLMVAEAQRSKLWAPTMRPTAARTMAIMNVAAFSPFLLSIPVAFVDDGLAKYMWILAAPASAITGQVRERRQRRSAEAAEAAQDIPESESATV
jgi:uncharacterized membrane protein